MGFRIRNMTDDEAALEASEARYREHLDSFNKRTDSHLWKFFYWDFFHDGAIDGTSFDRSMKTLSLHITAPNIRRLLDNDGNYEFINVGFTCHFQNIVSLTFATDQPEPWDLGGDYYAEYRYGEINTSPLLETLPRDEGRPEPAFRSLLIELRLPPASWMEIVFSQVFVEADEPTAFALMETDSRFVVPVYDGT